MALVRFIYPREQLGRGIGINAHGGGGFRRRRPDDGRRHPGGRDMALSVCRSTFRSDWPRSRSACDTCRIRRARATISTGRARASARSPLASASRRSTASAMAKRCSPALPSLRGAVIAGVLLVRAQTHMTSPLLPVDLLRIPDFCALDCHLDRIVLRADAGLCRAALLSREPLRLFGRRDRASDHALADRGRLCRPTRRTAGRALSGRPSRRYRACCCLRCGLGALAMLPAHPSLSTWPGAWRWPARALACSRPRTTAP